MVKIRFIYILINLLLIIKYANSATAAHVYHQLLLMPYPKELNANFKKIEDSVEIANNIKLKLDNNCNAKCKEFMEDNFYHSITFSLIKQKGLKNYRLSLFEQIDLPRFTPNILGIITEVKVTFEPEENKEICPKLFMGVNESYKLNINNTSIEIQAPTVYGARHAFETLIQLISIDDSREIFVVSRIPISIIDEPRFRWRGLMVDPSRNLLSPEIFYRIIDALAGLKANVLHIHLSDAQAFTFESKKFPNLSKKGMYDQSRVLTQEKVKDLAEYGRRRGVILYGEIDIPSHTAAIGLGYPGTVCNYWDGAITSSGYGENYLALNPTNETTFKIIEALMEELSECFDNEFIHVGGDEVQFSAWGSAPEYNEIQKFMKDKNLKTFTDLEGYFNKYAQDEVIKHKKRAVVWQEVFENGFLRDSSVVHSWMGTGSLIHAVNNKRYAIFSSGWYLDVHSPNGGGQYFWTWTNRNMYQFDPTSGFTEEQLKYVYGGEGCSWGENCDEQNIFDRVFQRYGAIAERLWSPKNIRDTDSHEVRANWVRCLLLRRKIFVGTGPLYHAFCQTEDHKINQSKMGIYSFNDDEI